MTTPENLPAVVKSAPPHIWLQVSDEAHHMECDFPALYDAEDITWSSLPAVSCEVGYVRADLHQALADELANTREELAELRRQHDQRGGMLELTRMARDEAANELERLRAQVAQAMTPAEVRDGIAEYIDTYTPHREFWTPEVVDLVRSIEINPRARTSSPAAPAQQAEPAQAPAEAHELAPCPFCGEPPTTVERPDNIDGTEFFFAAACYCGGYSACAHKMAVRKTPEEAKAVVVAAWNARAAKPQPKGMPAEWLDAFEEWRQTLGAADLDGKRDLVWRHIAGTGFQAGAAWARSQAPAPAHDRKAQALALCHALEEQPGSQYQTAAVLAAFKVYRAFESIEKHGEIRQWVFDVAAPCAAVQAWQPIETAPKDGTEIIVSGLNFGDESRGRHVTMASWRNGHGWWEGLPDPVQEMRTANTQLQFLTHWMPLPAAPGFNVPVQPKEPTHD